MHVMEQKVRKWLKDHEQNEAARSTTDEARQAAEIFRALLAGPQDEVVEEVVEEGAVEKDSSNSEGSADADTKTDEVEGDDKKDE